MTSRPGEPSSPSRETTKRRRATFKLMQRQRSLSLESDTEFLRPTETTRVDGGVDGGDGPIMVIPGTSGTTTTTTTTNLSSRRSVSLKSSPLLSPRPALIPIILSAGKQQGERSIFAELRRSSEIFKSILLNLSMRELEAEEAQTAAGSAEQATQTEADTVNQVDVAGLLAAHERRRLASAYRTEWSSSSESSVSSGESSPDEASVSSGCPSSGSLGLTEPGSPLLTAGPGLAPLGLYTRRHLFTLPALFLAVVRGNSTLVYLLLKYGADVNFQVIKYIFNVSFT